LIAYDGAVVFSSTDMDNVEDDLERDTGSYVSRCTIPGDFLNYGKYFLTVASDFPMVQTHFFLDRGLSLRIEQTGGVGGSIPDGRLGMLRLRFPWNIQKVE
jgi:lipopolysaccharide transport system ATP-binding protein